MKKYAPESKAAKRERQKVIAKAKESGKDAGEAGQVKRVNNYLKYGLNNVTNLVERGVAKFVAIAHDVDPIELVLWLPQLCRKKNVPFVIVKGKARLGQLVGKKTATCIAITGVNDDRDKIIFKKLSDSAMNNFNNNSEITQDSDPILGHKSRLAEEARRRVIDREIVANT